MKITQDGTNSRLDTAENKSVGLKTQQWKLLKIKYEKRTKNKQ